ncbi:UPF0061-domain-containing protein [Microstroma glucosiphilum]|uniref:Selenoprotein O n=1 Tax=Pseudomicrostroma glucosiphilum TaxID=1684307 RepID=A0A316UC97_9BASI|nr:UPF0061-domain-containing protein [Pseudomicrostroma glucosiphilum]PWN22857.1 UPF0061-domain-containing protein [Pseudomicrostroma glucosiphilum]
MTARNNSPRRLVPLLSLPLPPPSQRLTNNLLPDAYTPSPTSLLSTPDSTPSLVRRARPVPQGAGFSYVTPLPLPFPYEFPAEQKEESDKEVSLGEQHRREAEAEGGGADADSAEARYERQMQEVERVMRRYEIQVSELDKPEYPAKDAEGLAGYLTPAKRAQTYPSARLLGLSAAALRDCLPNLDVGDAFEFIKSTSGRDGPDTYASGPMAPQPKDDAARARFQLSDVLAGRAVAAVLPSEESQLDDMAGCGVWARRVGQGWKDESLQQRWERRNGELLERQKQKTYLGWSNAYAGHQFGSWAGQLGDGRAITLFETINPENNERWEIQLKGAGRTPYSRFADGLATLGSSVREFLGSESIAALGIPTSRALSVISLPDVEVVRERRNVSAITSRLAQSWIRIGSFQLPASRSDWEIVRLLGEYVSRILFNFEGIPSAQTPDSPREKWATRLLFESARRNARMVAGWQAVGWTHGVLNTDNISILGLTIDYGPYGFLDIFSQDVTPNHSDEMSRYSYKMQPSMVLFAMKQLLTSLSPIIGFEEENGRAPNPGELASLEPEKLKALAEFGEATQRADLEEVFINTTMEEWRRRFRLRLGLKNAEEDEKGALFDPLLDVLEELDFTLTLRKLKEFPSILEENLKSAEGQEEGIKKAVESFSADWYDQSRVLAYLRDQKRDQAQGWLTKYAQRLLRDLGVGSGSSSSPAVGWGTSLREEMSQHNPRFVLRNWVGEEVIKRLEEKDDTLFLDRVLQMCLHPCKEWGQDDGSGKSAELLEEEARLCEIGEPLQRNMPSCSS